MKFEDILTLIKAGYTKEEITAMDAGAAGTEQKPEGTDGAAGEAGEAGEAGAAGADGADGAAGAGQYQPQKVTTPEGADLFGILNKMNDTLAALQAAAITGDSRGSATKLSAGQSLAKAITMTK